MEGYDTRVRSFTRSEGRLRVPGPENTIGARATGGFELCGSSWLGQPRTRTVFIWKCSRFFDLVSRSCIIWIPSDSMSLKTHFVHGFELSASSIFTSVLETRLCIASARMSRMCEDRTANRPIDSDVREVNDETLSLGCASPPRLRQPSGLQVQLSRARKPRCPEPDRGDEGKVHRADEPELEFLLTASARLIVISTFSDRRFSVWAKWGRVP